MSRGSLPLYVEPFRLCDANVRVSGGLVAEQLERISEFGVGTTDGAQADLFFSRDVEGRNRITGTITSVLHTTCERCLRPLDVAVNAEVNLMVIAAGAKVPEVPEDMNIVEVEEERLALPALVEEEMLLVLPQFPVHESCEMIAYDRGAEEKAVVPEQKANPFDVLAHLKRKDS